MKKIEAKILRNHRTFDNPDEITFKTKLQCRGCLQVSGNYILLDGWIRICQSCLNEWTKMLQKDYINNVGNTRRKGESE